MVRLDPTQHLVDPDWVSAHQNQSMERWYEPERTWPVKLSVAVVSQDDGVCPLLSIEENARVAPAASM